MPNQFLTTFTKWPEEPSGGALLTHYTMPWNLALCQPLELSGHQFEWSATDEGTNGKVKFLTTVEVTGQTSTDVPQAAWYRMICYFLVSRLSEGSLGEA